MGDAGIHDGHLLLMDRSIRPRAGDVPVIADADGGFILDEFSWNERALYSAR